MTPTPRTAAKVRYEGANDFQQLLRARVDRYFAITGRRRRDCMAMYAKSAIVIAAFAGIYCLLVFAATTWWQAVPLAIGLGLAFAAIGFNIQHDGSHGAYSRYGWVNRAMAMWLDVVGASSFVWARKHNTLHHTYTNLDGHDDDIDLGILGRLSPQQQHRRYHTFQHLYLWVLYTVLVAKWHVFDDFRDVLRGRIANHRLTRPRGWDLVQFVAGKLVFFFLFLVLPAFLHPFGQVLLYYAIATATAGFVLSVIFQLAHVVGEAQFPVPEADGRIRTPFAIHQLETTVDFARSNRALSWFVGGLNFQIEHHLFPRICHLHYPKISRIVEKACRKAGIRYHAFPTLRSAIGSHYRWLRRMGRVPSREPDNRSEGGRGQPVSSGVSGS